MFDPVRICTILNEESVDYVVVGGFAAVVHGSSLPTRGIDLVPSRNPSSAAACRTSDAEDAVLGGVEGCLERA